MSPPRDVSRVQGFQLWLALPPEVETGTPESRYIEAKDMRQVGPAYVVVGAYEGVSSCVPAPERINYLLVTLQAEQRWTYRPPAGHTVAWLALAKGGLKASTPIAVGEMVLFDQSEDSISLQADAREGAVFVLGSAVPHPYPLHLGHYSVHTSAQTLATGEQRIAELGQKLKELGNRRTASGVVPVLR